MISGTTIFTTLVLAALVVAPMQKGGQKGKAAKPPPRSAGSGTATGTAKTPPVPELKTPEQNFDVCDYNGDGVIAFDEAHTSLGVDQDGFRVYDVDRDGLISLSEFKKRFQSILDNGGAFPLPVPKAKARKPARRTPQELLAQYDRSRDLALDARELKVALEEYQVLDLDPQVALEKLDSDGSKQLELAELEDLANILSPSATSKKTKLAKTIAELFGKKIPREMQEDTTPLPPRIAGPVSPFLRLDLDADGKISVKDLNELQRPLLLTVRINAVIATLDIDHDGVVSEKEFWRSMSR